jgi:hypothetical protein
MTSLHPLAERVSHPSPLRGAAPWWLVLTGLFLAPTAWSLQLLVSYTLNGDRCTLLHPGPRVAVLALIVVVALAACGFGLFAAVRTWRLTQEEAHGDHHAALSAGTGRTRFLGLCGIIASSIFLAGVVFAFLIPLMVSPCAPAFS